MTFCVRTVMLVTVMLSDLVDLVFHSPLLSMSGSL